MNLPLNACMHRLANYTPGGATHADSRCDMRRRKYDRFDFDCDARRVYFSPLSLSHSLFRGSGFYFSIPVYIRMRARGKSGARSPICFHDNHETVSTLRGGDCSLFFFYFVFYRRNSAVIFMTIRHWPRRVPRYIQLNIVDVSFLR